MTDEPTIEEAIKHATFVAEYYDGWVPETTAAIRTLLASHASLEEWVKEAKRLAESALAMLRHTHDRLLSKHPQFDLLCISINEECRALAAFVNEKERT